MTSSPFDPIELGGSDPDLEATAQRLDRYVADVDAPAPPDLAARIQAAIDEEPDPSRGWWAAMTSALVVWRRPAAALAAVAMTVAVIVGSIALGDLFENLRNVGASPDPSPVVSPAPSVSPSASPTPSPTPSPSGSPSPSATPSTSPSATPTAPASPTASDDDLETPDASDDAHSSDDSGGNSGPGGGGDD